METRQSLLLRDSGSTDRAMSVARHIADDPSSLFDVPAHARIIRHQVQHRERHAFSEGRALDPMAEIPVAQPHLLSPQPKLDLGAGGIARDVLATSDAQGDDRDAALLR